MGLAVRISRRPGRQLRDHLLPAGAARDDRSGRSRQPDEGGRLRRDRPRAADDADQGILHAALPGARRSEREAPCEQYPWDGVRNVRPVLTFPEIRRRRAFTRRDPGSGKTHAAFSNPSMGRSIPQRQPGGHAALPHARAVRVDEPGQSRPHPPRPVAPGRGARGAAEDPGRGSHRDGGTRRQSLPQRHAAARSGKRHHADAAAIHRAGVGHHRHAVQQRAPQHAEGPRRARQGGRGARRTHPRSRPVRARFEATAR